MACLAGRGRSSAINVLTRLAIATLAFFAGGCVQQQSATYLAEDRPIPQSHPPLSLEQIETRVIRAGKDADWRTRPIQPGQLRGETNWPGYEATIVIDHDRLAYRIRFEAARALDKGKNGPKLVDEAQLHGVSPSEFAAEEPMVAAPEDRDAAVRENARDPEIGTEARLHGGRPEDIRATRFSPGSGSKDTNGTAKRPENHQDIDEAQLHGGSPDIKKEKDKKRGAIPMTLSAAARAVRWEYNRRVRKLEEAIDRELAGATQ